MFDHRYLHFVSHDLCSTLSIYSHPSSKCTVYMIMRSQCLSFSSLFLTGGGTHVHVCVIVRWRYRRWRHGHRKSLALGVWGVRPGQGVRGWVACRLRRHLVAPSRRRPRGRAALAAHLEVAFGRCRGRLVELDGDVAGGYGGAAASLRRRPGGFWVEELAAVVAALGQAGAVECGVGAVHLFLGVALHKQIDWHHPGPLRQRVRRGSRKRWGGDKMRQGERDLVT